MKGSEKASRIVFSIVVRLAPAKSNVSLSGDHCIFFCQKKDMKKQQQGKKCEIMHIPWELRIDAAKPLTSFDMTR